MKQIFRYFLLGLGAAAGLSACNKEGGAAPDATSLHVDFHVMTDLNVVKSAALSDENKVTAIDLFAFDAASGLLEVMQRDIPAKAPSDAGVAGEKKVGDVSLSFGKGEQKKSWLSPTLPPTASNCPLRSRRVSLLMHRCSNRSSGCPRATERPLLRS